MHRSLLNVMSALSIVGSAAAYADHDIDKPIVAHDSFRLADSAEKLAREAFARDRQIAYAADELHMQASDVYHLARRGAEDHTDDAIIDEFQDVTYAYRYLERLFYESTLEDHTLDTLWDHIRYDYRRLHYDIEGFHEDLGESSIKN